jgi:NAD(P)-dependent dehydrogenase (short-subunit alcohol dehydrogenase family)
MSLDINTIFGLSGRAALVTGSSRGIGAAIAQGMAAAGAHVFVHGRAKTSAENVTKLIKTAGGSADSLAGDLAEIGSGRTLINECERRTGGLDILVINASVQVNSDLSKLSDDDLSWQINVNLRSTIEMLQTCLPLMANRRWGRVISIGSINQSHPKPIVTAYAALKSAQHNLIQSQARHYAQTGVVLNTLAPGLIDTDRNADRKINNPTAWLEYTKQANWMGRVGKPDEMVGAALFLASKASSFITGESINLSGGY